MAGLADSTLLLSLHPDGSRVAVARGPALCVCPVLPEPPPDSSLPAGVQALQDRRGTHTAAAPRGRGTSGGGSFSRSSAGSADGGGEACRRSRNASEHTLPGKSTGGAGSAQQQPMQFMCPASSGPAVVGADDITAMAWLAFARPPGVDRRSGGGAPLGAASGGGGGGDGDAAAAYRRRTGSSGSGGVFASIQAMVEDQVELEQQRRRQQLQQGIGGGGRSSIGGGGGPPHPGYSCSVLLSGTRGGCLQLHDADSGAVLMRQQLHSGPVVSIAVRTWRMGMKPDDAVEDVTVAWADALVRLAAWELRTAAASCYAAAAAAARGTGGGGGGGTASLTSRFGLWGSSATATPAGPEIKPLAGQKWELPAALRNRTCAVCVGQRPRDLYSLLQGIGTSNATATGKTIFLAGGDRPACLAALEVDEQGSGGASGALSVISSVASGVMGLARTARSVAAAPLTIGSSIASFMLNPLQLGTSTNTSTSAASTGMRPSSSASSFHDASSSFSASGTAPSSSVAHPADPAAIPLASFPDGTAGQRLPMTGCWRQHRDDGRVVGCLAPAPHGSLVAAADGLGRVTLVEAGGMLVSRLWKGYRDAQVGWLEVPLSALARRQQLQRQQDAELKQQRRQEQEQERQADAGAGGEQDQEEAPEPVKQQSAGGAAGGSGRPPLGGFTQAPGAVAGGGFRPRLEPQDILMPPHTHSNLPSRRGTGGGAGQQQQQEEEEDQEQYVLLLAIYAPRRQTLELWWPLHGDRLGAVAVPQRNARLLQRGCGGPGSGAELGTWRVGDAASAASPPMTPAGCMLCVAAGAAAAAAGDRCGALEAGEEWAAGWGEGQDDVSPPPGDVGGYGTFRAGLELVDVASMFGLR
ncbi:hypothetical protein HYH02_008451 [Chlamydomonas schloesseri]|uniref:Rab3-GAP regulatory subunit N-terminal domain-containing protein n=1 Tax=Chlamydomonas schloesseri TaxID=2026947 RepID=A0A835WFA4_9CHLO|nr:hypothetical protein HYH02_008451 [Chlamydomonas schloesseri]|eukprot:KAG2446459.1 hypothetical protein HYH02_008451 [Chlamydomonas schloesseri]